MLLKKETIRGMAVCAPQLKKNFKTEKEENLIPRGFVAPKASTQLGVSKPRSNAHAVLRDAQ
jgi:hypothetical protein